eukprot:m.416948 g.416948  ORF g.416948 m.416948 type:complete len:123 (-) comp30185_c0_seq1:135-503(-)
MHRNERHTAGGSVDVPRHCQSFEDGIPSPRSMHGRRSKKLPRSHGLAPRQKSCAVLPIGATAVGLTVGRCTLGWGPCAIVDRSCTLARHTMFDGVRDGHGSGQAAGVQVDVRGKCGGGGGES